MNPCGYCMNSSFIFPCRNVVFTPSCSIRMFLESGRLWTTLFVTCLITGAKVSSQLHISSVKYTVVVLAQCIQCNCIGSRTSRVHTLAVGKALPHVFASYTHSHCLQPNCLGEFALHCFPFWLPISWSLAKSGGRAGQVLRSVFLLLSFCHFRQSISWVAVRLLKCQLQKAVHGDSWTLMILAWWPCHNHEVVQRWGQIGSTLLLAS